MCIVLSRRCMFVIILSNRSCDMTNRTWSWRSWYNMLRYARGGDLLQQVTVEWPLAAVPRQNILDRPNSHGIMFRLGETLLLFRRHLFSIHSDTGTRYRPLSSSKGHIYVMAFPLSLSLSLSWRFRRDWDVSDGGGPGIIGSKAFKRPEADVSIRVRGRLTKIKRQNL